MVCWVGSEPFQNRAIDTKPNTEAIEKSGMVSKVADKSSNTKVHPLAKISELSLLSDLLYMPTGTGSLSYGHVLTAVCLATTRFTNLDVKLRPDTGQ